MILTNLFKLVVTNFFDVEVGTLAQSAWKTAEAALQLLGWQLSLGDEKRRPFEKSFEILGAVITLPTPGESDILVTKKTLADRTDFRSCWGTFDQQGSTCL